ncbi:unnamed protein product [Macrosiphum euphorbiae]|uniref:SWIM-type domain-containing protein n=1 Tax=Macrosiphum euphorbiae TaxID=13131 RepID=A0AAV0WGQ5_9HEMI|nr:unnamed protein product [Macrosiphum euphorbiae]
MSITKAQKKYLRYKSVDTSPMLFDVTNILHNTQYLVDLDLGICSCPRGDTGFPCKHQMFIAQKLNIDLSICLPMTEDMKKKLHIIASGCSDIESGWYGSATDMNYVEFNEDNNKDSDQNSIQTNKQSKQINENMDPEINNENIDQTYDEVMDSFNKTVEDMKKKFDSDKTYFLPAITSFVNSYKKNVRTDASLTSAMETFGKYSGLNHTSKKPKLCSNKEIGTQPTARSRRVTQIGGRKTLIAGRCPKWKNVTEHGYSSNSLSSSQLPRKPFNPTQLPPKPQKMPHSINYFVEANKSVGATHSAK